MSSDGRLRIRCRATTALCCSLASLAVLSASPAHAADECGPVPLGGGTIECPTADYPSGISYDAGVEDLTVVVDAGSTVEGGFELQGNSDLSALLYGVDVSSTSDFQNAVSVVSGTGQLILHVADATSSGDGAAGVYARDSGTYAAVYSGNVLTTGDGAAGVQVIGDAGYQVVVADFTTTTGEGSTGISVGTKTGDILALTFGIETKGDDSAGVQLSSGDGDVVLQNGQHILVGQITTHGDNSDAVDLMTVGGDIASKTQIVTTFGDSSAGIHAVSATGDVLIRNGFNTSPGTITTYGMLSDGIHVETGGATAIYSDTVRTFGQGSDGIDVTSTGDQVGIFSNLVETYGGGRGIAVDALENVNIYSGAIDTVGAGGTGIHATTHYGNIVIDSGSVSTQGSGAFGIFARSELGSVSVGAGDVETNGFYSNGIVAQGWGDVNVDAYHVSTHSPSFGAYGIIANAHGDASVTVHDVDVYGLHSYGVLAVGYGNASIKADTVRSSHTDAYGSAIGSGGLVAVAYNGTASVSVYDVYAQGLGVYASGGGGASIDAGFVRVNQDYGAGIAAQSTNGDVRIGVGLVDVTGYYAEGIVAADENGQLEINADVVHVSGYLGAGILTFSPYAEASVNVGTLFTEGDGTIGALLQSIAGDITFTFDELGTTGNGAFGISAVSRYGGDILISGDDAFTVGGGASVLIAEAFGGSATIKANHVVTYGPYSAPIIAYSAKVDEYYGTDVLYGDINIDVGSVETNGTYSRGIFTHSNQGDTFINAGDVEVNGDNSVGIFAFSSFIGIDPSFGTSDYGDITTHVDQLTVRGNGSAGAFMYNQGSRPDGSPPAHMTGDFDRIDISGEASTGVVVDTPLLLAGLPAPIDVDVNVGDLEMTGDYDLGVIVYGGLGHINVDVDKLVGTGHGTAGVIVLGRNGADLDVNVGNAELDDPGGDLSYFSPAIYAVSSGGNVTVSAGSVHTEGTYSDGVVAASNGQTDYYGQIRVGDVHVEAADVVTSGYNAVGIAATSFGGNVNVHAGTVETHGDYSIGVSANALAFVPTYGTSDHALRGGDLTVVADDVTTTGNHSDAVSALGFSGGNTNVTVGTVETSGDDSYGVNVVTSGQADDLTGQFYGGSTTVTVDKATTSGVGSNGVRVFAFTGDVDLTVGSVDVSGEYSDAVTGVSGSSGSTVVNILDHAISKQGFGVAASAYDDVSVNVTDSARVSGGQVGVYANAYQNIDVSVGDEAGIFGGQIGLYAGVGGNTQASALITNLGTIATSSSGIAIVGDAHDITIENRGTVIGPVQLTGHLDLFDNSGTWQAFGNSAFGFGSDTVLNSGRFIVGVGNAGEHVNVTGLDTFDNRGLITMADGHADQVLNLDRATFVGDTGSRVAIDLDADAHGLTSDLIKLGVASGATEIQLNGHGGLGTALVVDANASSGAGNFYLPGGSVDLGFVRMSLDYNAAKSNWSLVGAPDQEAFEGTQFAAQAESLWRRGIDVWSQTLDEAPTPGRFTLWGKYLTGHESQDRNPTFTTLGVTSTPTLDTDARWDGALVGASFGRGPWSWGALVGVTSQTTRFTFDDNKLRTKGTNFGAYAAWQSDRMFARAVANYQHVRPHADLPTASLADARMHGSVAGVRGEMGVRLPLGGAEFRPTVSATWTRGHLSNLTAPAATLNFDGFTSLEVSAGALLSGAMRVGTATVHPYAGLYGVKEFRGRNSLDLEVGSQSLRLVGQPQNDHAKATAGFAADLGGAFRLSVGGEAEFFGGRNALKGQIGLSWHG